MLHKSSYTNSNLPDLIDDKKHSDIKRILNERDEQGIPLVNLNQGSINEPTIALYATSLLAGKADFQICRSILEVCDHNGQPVTDLNATNSSNGTILSNILRSTSFTIAEKQTLINIVVSYRNPNGDPIFDITKDQNSKPLLFLAIDTNNFDLVNTLLDWRRSDGEHAIDVNEFYHGYTALDYINSLKISNKKTLKKLLLSFHARTYQSYKDLNKQKEHRIIYNLTEAINDVVPPIKPHHDFKMNLSDHITADTPKRGKDIIKQEASEFANATQNTHSLEVEASVTASIKNLKNHYRKAVDDEKKIETCFIEIENFIKSLPEKNNQQLAKKKIAMSAFERINGIQFKGTDQSKVTSNLPHREIIALVWAAANDEKAFPPDNLKVNPKQLVANRKEAFIEKLIEAQTAYRTSYSCVGGTRNLIVESLNHAHPDVTVIYTKAMGYNAFVSKLANQFAEEYKKQPLEIQKKIIKHWDEEKDPAAAFRRQFKSQTQEDIQQAGFKDDCDKIYALVFNSPPALEKNLQTLLDSIGGLYFTPDKPLYPLVQKLKGLADVIFDDEKKSFSDEYQFLNSAYESFKKHREDIDSIIQFCTTFKIKIPPVKIDEKKSINEMASTIKATFIPLLEPCKEKVINDTKDDIKRVVECKQREFAIKKFWQYQNNKKIPNHIFVNSWLASIDTLKKIDTLATALITEMNTYSSKNMKRQQALTEINLAIEKAYLSFKINDKGQAFKEFQQTVDQISRSNQEEYQKSSFIYPVAKFFPFAKPGTQSELSSKINSAIQSASEKNQPKK